MAFVIETGEGLTNSNGYVSASEFVTHHTDRNITQIVDEEFETSEIEAAIVRATDYIDKRFGRRFRGYRKSRSQALEWPRLDAYDDEDYALDPIPAALKKATSEYALLSLQLARDLAPVPALDYSILSDGEFISQPLGAVKRSTEKVGPIEDTKEYSTASDANKLTTSTQNMSQNIPAYPQADLWIEELIVSSTTKVLYRG